jgi:hypothetical protein
MASPRENALGISRKTWSRQTWQMLTQDLEAAEKKWGVELNRTGLRRARFRMGRISKSVLNSELQISKSCTLHRIIDLTVELSIDYKLRSRAMPALPR